MEINRLITQIKEGDKAAFKELYVHYAPLFKGIAYRYTGSLEDSNDVLQETFIKIFKNINSYTGEGNFEGWMKRILVNVCLDLIKKERKFKFESDEAILEVPSSKIEEALSAMTMQEIVKVVDILPDGYKLVFNLSVFEGYSHKEIGEKLGITPSASRSQLTKAKAKLKEELKRLDIYSAVG